MKLFLLVSSAFFFGYSVYCQDQIFYVNGGDEHVDKINRIDSDYLHFQSTDGLKSIPLYLLLT